MLSTALDFPGDKESSLLFVIGGPRFFPRVGTTMTTKRFVKLYVIVYFRIL